MPPQAKWKIVRKAARARRYAPTFALLISAAAPSHSNTAPADGPGRSLAGVTLSITATGFRSIKGQAIIALYSSPESWLKSEKALHVQAVRIDSTSVTVRFADLAPGIYAASAIHDENENGKLDMRYFPIPRPRGGAGVSNNARRTLGPPAWDAARFTLPDSAYAVTIVLRY